MKSLTTMGLVVLATVVVHAGHIYHDLNDAPELFEKFVRDYERKYKDTNDITIHYEAFKKSLENINELNKKEPFATFDINKFADYTEEELQNIRGFGTRRPHS